MIKPAGCYDIQIGGGKKDGGGNRNRQEYYQFRKPTAAVDYERAAGWI
jgi:hypothetical protein